MTSPRTDFPIIGKTRRKVSNHLSRAPRDWKKTRELPKGWRWVTLGEMIPDVVYGTVQLRMQQATPKPSEGGPTRAYSPLSWTVDMDERKRIAAEEASTVLRKGGQP